MGVVEEAVGEGEVSVVVELREDRRRKSLLGRNRAIGREVVKDGVPARRSSRSAESKA